MASDFEVQGWPTAADVETYSKELGIPAEAVIRDIARIVTVAQMVHEGQLSEDWVLSGGMAMRLRGSPRFTMSDTDTSHRLGTVIDRETLAEAVSVDQSELVVKPVEEWWRPGKQLVTAKPL